MAPQANVITLKDDDLTIEAIIEGNEEITKSSIFVLQNGHPLGQKADVVQLGQSDKTGTTVNFSTIVPLIEGENQLKIGVVLADSTIAYSLTRILYKTDANVREIGQNYQTDEKGIFWLHPFWQSTPLVVEEQRFNLQAIINTPVAIQKEDIYLTRQEIIKIPLAADTRLKELSPGKYKLTTSFRLEGEGLIRLQIKVKSSLAGTLQSTPLTINYSPYRPNVHLLAVGTQTNLNYTIEDATDFAHLFESQAQLAGGQLFNTVTIHTLTGTAATTTAIKVAIERLTTKFKNGNIGKKDLIVLYLSSHGFLDHQGQFRLQGDDYDPGARLATSVAYQRDIIEVLVEIPCKKLIFIDACHSGGGEKGIAIDIQYQIEQLNKRLQGTTTMVSSNAGEVSYEDEQWENGAFTEAIIEGLLQYRADSNYDYLITINELWQYVRTRVPAMVMKRKNKTQHPQLLTNELGDLAIYSVK